MKRQIEVKNDSETIELSTTTELDVYRMRVHMGEHSPIYIDFSDAELREVKYLIDEILQLANKRDW